MTKRICVILLTLLTTLAASPAAFAADAASEDAVRGVWVSTVYRLDYPSAATTSAAALKKQADSILDGTKAMGLNTVFLQVRPSSDALYPSKVFPWSRYLTGKQGTAPAGGFDPLAYWVQGAHKRGLKLQAWINPYRVTKEKDAEWKTLSASNPAKQHPDWVRKYTDGNYYYDPGLPAVRQLVVKGVQEILDNYDVDGIHLDDYFYPGTDFNDAATYKTYGKGYADCGDWRRENVNILVRTLHNVVRAKGGSVVFGVSPAGIWANKSHNPKGSDTNGNESYYSGYADSLGWVKNGSVDYIIPQIYWQIGNKAADYKTLVSWWSGAVKGTGVKLYIGEAAYKCGDASQGAAWKGAAGAAELARHLRLCDAVGGIDGNVYFRYGSLLQAAGVHAAITGYYAAQAAAGQIETPKTETVQTGTVSTSSAQTAASPAAVSQPGLLHTLSLFFESILRQSTAA